ncbi:YadA-like family protein [uncultured Cloacibacillus sp.]|uniref:YadA-like family protein n=1 Tax=uncultured Cloacibacillus sp. TaxID=889794 RepID=UPI0026DC8756|nr:YadA-like family protein [uncultured Cloacibacillus sp.]
MTANDINVGKVNISGSGINMGGADITTGGGNIDMGGGRITNVAGGAVAQGSTEAVNGGQLWEAYQRMDAMGGDIYRRMDDLREDVNIVGAHAAALSGLHPIDYNPYEPTTLSAAIGTYRDEYAVAVGVFHYAKENVMFNLGASLCSDGDLMGRAGVSFTVGKSSDKPKVAGTMNGLRNQVIAMQAKLDELEAEKKQDKETIRRNEETLRKNEEIMKQNAKLIRELTKKLEAKR